MWISKQLFLILSITYLIGIQFQGIDLISCLDDEKSMQSMVSQNIKVKGGKKKKGGRRRRRNRDVSMSGISNMSMSRGGVTSAEEKAAPQGALLGGGIAVGAGQGKQETAVVKAKKLFEDRIERLKAEGKMKHAVGMLAALGGALLILTVGGYGYMVRRNREAEAQRKREQMARGPLKDDKNFYMPQVDPKFVKDPAYRHFHNIRTKLVDYDSEDAGDVPGITEVDADLVTDTRVKTFLAKTTELVSDKVSQGFKLVTEFHGTKKAGREELRNEELDALSEYMNTQSHFRTNPIFAMAKSQAAATLRINRLEQDYLPSTLDSFVGFQTYYNAAMLKARFSESAETAVRREGARGNVFDDHSNLTIDERISDYLARIPLTSDQAQAQVIEQTGEKGKWAKLAFFDNFRYFKTDLDKLVNKKKWINKQDWALCHMMLTLSQDLRPYFEDTTMPDKKPIRMNVSEMKLYRDKLNDMWMAQIDSLKQDVVREFNALSNKRDFAKANDVYKKIVLLNNAYKSNSAYPDMPKVTDLLIMENGKPMDKYEFNNIRNCVLIQDEIKDMTEWIEKHPEEAKHNPAFSEHVKNCPKSLLQYVAKLSERDYVNLPKV